MDRKDIEYMNGKRILIVDDVISTGGSLHALETLAAQSTGTVVGCCAAWPKATLPSAPTSPSWRRCRCSSTKHETEAGWFWSRICGG